MEGFGEGVQHERRVYVYVELCDGEASSANIKYIRGKRRRQLKEKEAMEREERERDEEYIQIEGEPVTEKKKPEEGERDE